MFTRLCRMRVLHRRVMPRDTPSTPLSPLNRVIGALSQT